MTEEKVIDWKKLILKVASYKGAIKEFYRGVDATHYLLHHFP